MVAAHRSEKFTRATSRAGFLLPQNGIAPRYGAKILRLRTCVANHFSPIRSFLIDSDLRQARAVRFMQNIFAHDLQCTRRRAVAKTIAIAGEKICCAARAKNLGACKITLFYRVFCNSRLAGDLQGFYRARDGVVSANDAFTTAHDVSDACAIHIG